MKNSHQLFKFTALLCASLSSGAFANQNVIPIEPVGSKVERQAQTAQPENKAAVAAMVDQVVKSLPTDKQESLSKFTPVDDPAAKQPVISSTAVDEFGRVTTKKNQNVIVASPPSAQATKPSLTAFERMQRQMAKKFKHSSL